MILRSAPSPALAVGLALAHTAASAAGNALCGRWGVVQCTERLLGVHFAALLTEAEIDRDRPGLPWALAGISRGMTLLRDALRRRDGIAVERALAEIAQRGAALADGVEVEPPPRAARPALRLVHSREAA